MAPSRKRRFPLGKLLFLTAAAGAATYWGLPKITNHAVQCKVNANATVSVVAYERMNVNLSLEDPLDIFNEPFRKDRTVYVDDSCKRIYVDKHADRTLDKVIYVLASRDSVVQKQGPWDAKQWFVHEQAYTHMLDILDEKAVLDTLPAKHNTIIADTLPANPQPETPVQDTLPSLDATTDTTAGRVAGSAMLDASREQFEWTYEGKKFVITVPTDTVLLAAFTDVSQEVRLKMNLEDFIYEARDDTLLERLSATVKTDAARTGLSDIRLALSFVQSIPYKSDDVMTNNKEYIQYPYETLMKYWGDCEDKSILFAELARKLGYDCCLFEIRGNPGHISVGIVLPEEIAGDYVPFNGLKYYYAETTVEGLQLGDVPQEMQGVNHSVIPIRQHVPRTAQYVGKQSCS
ncbi:MAG: hypothetical protein V1725_04525 [archaeon]